MAAVPSGPSLDSTPHYTQILKYSYLLHFEQLHGQKFVVFTVCFDRRNKFYNFRQNGMFLGILRGCYILCFEF
jgi:hypothetical protein